MNDWVKEFERRQRQTKRLAMLICACGLAVPMLLFDIPLLVYYGGSRFYRIMLIAIKIIIIAGILVWRKTVKE